VLAVAFIALLSIGIMSPQSRKPSPSSTSSTSESSSATSSLHVTYRGTWHSTSYLIYLVADSGGTYLLMFYVEPPSFPEGTHVTVSGTLVTPSKHQGSEYHFDGDIWVESVTMT